MPEDKRLRSQKAIKRSKRKATKAISERGKEILYRGKTLDQLLAMEPAEFLKMIPARARRSLKRGYNVEQQKLHDRLLEEDSVKTRVRDLIILPQYVGKTVSVYNGHLYQTFSIKEEMIGHYLGEYSQTRKEVKHSGPGVGATRGSKFLPLK
ncbi:MAG: 30S ribosomal protein S19P [Thermoplasmatales archaeon I-plasma]|jgi:small subunit ribosomal protein S19|nr:MAG: 30S ribosomal protein S19P [Thermoplasmatales archaeon I-plasma]MCL5930131.1 30S ribosomal protein S19 [Candidatus Thermoplasmatota archaeon]